MYRSEGLPTTRLSTQASAFETSRQPPLHNVPAEYSQEVQRDPAVESYRMLHDLTYRRRDEHGQWQSPRMTLDPYDMRRITRLDLVNPCDVTWRLARLKATQDSVLEEQRELNRRLEELEASVVKAHENFRRWVRERVRDQLDMERENRLAREQSIREQHHPCAPWGRGHAEDRRQQDTRTINGVRPIIAPWGRGYAEDRRQQDASHHRNQDREIIDERNENEEEDSETDEEEDTTKYPMSRTPTCEREFKQVFQSLGPYPPPVDPNTEGEEQAASSSQTSSTLGSVAAPDQLSASDACLSQGPGTTTYVQTHDGHGDSGGGRNQAERQQENEQVHGDSSRGET